MFDRRFSIDFFKVSGYTILYTRGESRVVVGRMDVRKMRDGWTDGRTDGRAGEGAYETIRFEQLSATTSLKFSVSASWWNECLSL